MYTAHLRSSWNKDHISAEICRAQVVLEIKFLDACVVFIRCGVVLIGLNMPASPLRPTHTVPWNTGRHCLSFFSFELYVSTRHFLKTKLEFLPFLKSSSGNYADYGLSMNHQTMILTWDFLSMLPLSAPLASWLPPRLILSLFSLQGARLSPELWGLLRSIPVPERHRDEPRAKVSRLVGTTGKEGQPEVERASRKYFLGRQRHCLLTYDWAGADRTARMLTHCILSVYSTPTTPWATLWCSNLCTKKILAYLSCQVWSAVSGWVGLSFLFFALSHSGRRAT